MYNQRKTSTKPPTFFTVRTNCFVADIHKYSTGYTLPTRFSSHREVTWDSPAGGFPEFREVAIGV